MKLVTRPLSLVTVLALALAAKASTSDFTRTAVPNWNGREGVTFVRYVSKDSNKVYGSAFVFDLSKGYRLRTWLGASNEPGCAPAAVGAMAEAIYATDGVLPLAGITGDYFDTSVSYARPTGMVISDSELVSTGFGRVSLTANCYLAETGDHNLRHGKLDCVEGLAYGGQPTASWQLNAGGRKVRNAIRTNYCNYPVRGGAINPVGSSSGESAFSTTIGNMQSRNYYYRTLVGIGTNAVGVATNLVLFSNTVYNGVLGIGDSPFPDVDAYQMMIDLGCNEVGELDGGGSATIWSESCTSLQNFFKGGTTAHGGYVNEYRDSSPRQLACGLFVMPPPATPDTIAVNGVNTYPDMAEAMRVLVPGDTLRQLTGGRRSAVAVDDGNGGIALEWNPDIVFGRVSATVGGDGTAATNGVVTAEVAKVNADFGNGAFLRLTLFDATNAVLGTVDRPFAGVGTYTFDTAGAVAPSAFGEGMYFPFAIALLDHTGAPVATAPTTGGMLRLAVEHPWFSAVAATDETVGGDWTAKPVLADGTWRVRIGEPAAVFEAMSGRGGIPRVEIALRQFGGYAEEELPALLAEAVAEGLRGAIVSVDNPDGTASLRGLARVGGSPAWVALQGIAFEPGDEIVAAMECDLTGATPMVSYLADVVSAGGAGASPVPCRLQSPSGAFWLEAAGPSATDLAGSVSMEGRLEIASLEGTSALLGRTPQWRDATGNYSVAVLGDTHFDAAPDSLYHAAYDTSTSSGAYGISEYRRSAEMWQERMPSLLAASAQVAQGGSVPAPSGADLPTRFVLQLGDIINGDCNDNAVHRQMLDDALAATRAPYDAAIGGNASAGGSGGAALRPLPFLTVLGNHDFRGSPNGRAIYFDWAEPLLSAQIGESCAYPLFSFRVGRDRWIFCDFERVSLFDVAAEVESDPDARYVFLVTHGPFTACESGNNWIWRLSAWRGKGGTGLGVPELFEAISRRRAIVLSGHTHYTAFYRNENQYGGYTEFTANSVWKSADLASAEPIPGHDKPSAYGTWRMEEVSAANRAAYDTDIALFKAGLKEYFLGKGAGHFRLEVTDRAVKMLFYPGDATVPARVFDLTPGPRPSSPTILLLQ